MMRRLLDLEKAAQYLGISAEAMGLYVKKKIILPVPLPSCRGKSKKMRRVLIDRYDLDRLIDAQKSAIHGKRIPSRETLVDKILRERNSNSGKFKVIHKR